MTATAPIGTVVTSYVLDAIAQDGTTLSFGGQGSPPARKELTFTTSGTYTVRFSIGNDAGGSSVTDEAVVEVAGAKTTAVLSISDTTKLTAGWSSTFDASSSYAGPAGVTLASVVLDYGDGTTPVPFNGDQALWFDSHSFARRAPTR